MTTAPGEPAWQQLVPQFTHPLRFSIVAALAGADSLDFRDIRNSVQTTDSTLSKQLRVLEEAGLVAIRKSFVGKYPRTSARLTDVGRAAWNTHIRTLRAIAGSDEV